MLVPFDLVIAAQGFRATPHRRKTASPKKIHAPPSFCRISIAITSYFEKSFFCSKVSPYIRNCPETNFKAK
jgi:hypothetical protein